MHLTPGGFGLAPAADIFRSAGIPRRPALAPGPLGLEELITDECASELSKGTSPA